VNYQVLFVRNGGFDPADCEILDLLEGLILLPFLFRCGYRVQHVASYQIESVEVF